MFLQRMKLEKMICNITHECSVNKYILVLHFYLVFFDTFEIYSLKVSKSKTENIIKLKF